MGAKGNFILKMAVVIIVMFLASQAMAITVEQDNQASSTPRLYVEASVVENQFMPNPYQYGKEYLISGKINNSSDDPRLVSIEFFLKDIFGNILDTCFTLSGPYRIPAGGNGLFKCTLRTNDSSKAMKITYVVTGR